MENKIINKIVGVCFGLILAVVFIMNIITKDVNFSEEENRMMEEFPKFSISSYMEGRFENKFDSYSSDQFIGRNSFIKMKTALDVTLGKVESNGVYNCKDGYLMEDITVPSKETLGKTLTALKQFRRTMPNIKMYFMLAPNAANILSDKLPNTVRTADQNKYIEDFYKSLQDIDYKTIDVRDALSAAAKNTQIYYKTDHHWTTDGAYIAYKEALKSMNMKSSVTYKSYAVKNDFRGTLASKSGFVNGISDVINIYMPDNDQDYKNSVIYYSDTKKKTTRFYELDNLNTKDAYTVFGGSNHPLYTIETPTDNNDTLLLVKDSYANSFIPFIAQNYRKVVVVDPRYFFENINDIIKSEEVNNIMFLYNANTFFGDDSLEMMLTAQ